MKGMRIKELSEESGLDIEEVLICLWMAGIEYVESPNDMVHSRDLRAARGALGIDDPRSQRRIEYWVRRSGLSRQDFDHLLKVELGISVTESARVLPSGAMKKLRLRFSDGDESVEDEVDSVDQSPDLPPLRWQDVGQRRNISYLDEEEILDIHYSLVRDFAGSDDPLEPPGLRSRDLLSSAAHRPLSSFGGEFKYPTVEMAAAALLHSLVLNHPFFNGNKRTGVVSMLVFLDRNSFFPQCNEDELFKFVIQVASHRLLPENADDKSDREVMKIAQWIHAKSRLISKGERPIPWHRMRRILSNFECQTDFKGGVGNRINIHRQIRTKTRLGRRKIQNLSVQVRYSGEGSEIPRQSLNYIRAELQLDEEHGFDSRVFYEADAVPDDFIQEYRTLLRRLARI